MKLQQLPLLAFAMVGLLTGCDQPQLDLSALQDKLSNLEDSVAASTKAASQLRADLAKLRDDHSKTEDYMTKAREETARTRQAVQALVQEFASYRMDYHNDVHKHAAGMALGDLVLGGSTFHNVVVKSVDDVALSFQHREGFNRVALANVPQKLQELFAYDPVLAAKAATPIVPANTGGLPPVMPASVAAIPQSARTASAGTANTSPQPSGAKSLHLANGVNIEVLGVLGGVGFPKSMGGTGTDTCTTGGSTVQGGKSNLPPGYKPIGSSYTGTAMDKLHKKDKTRP